MSGTPNGSMKGPAAAGTPTPRARSNGSRQPHIAARGAQLRGPGPGAGAADLRARTAAGASAYRMPEPCARWPWWQLLGPGPAKARRAGTPPRRWRLRRPGLAVCGCGSRAPSQGGWVAGQAAREACLLSEGPWQGMGVVVASALSTAAETSGAVAVLCSPWGMTRG